MLAFSRDGYHFDRPHREAVISTADDPNAWNYGNVQSVAGGGPVVGDRLYMYASGRNAKEDTTRLYIWRRDGFASMDAGDEAGTLVTRPVVFGGRPGAEARMIERTGVQGDDISLPQQNLWVKNIAGRAKKKYGFLFSGPRFLGTIFSDTTE